MNPDTTAVPSGQALQRTLRQVVQDGDLAQRRIFATYVVARALLALILVLVQGGHWLASGGIGRGLMALGGLYAVQALCCWALPSYRSADAGRITLRQWWATVAVDAAAFSTMHALGSTGNLSYAALLVLPAMMAGVLSTWVPALATVSAMSLALLLVALKSFLGPDGASHLMQAGLVGAGLFTVTLFSGQMASWVASEERAALGSLGLAHQQAALSHLVIEEMAEGVLVVDRAQQVRMANRAARALLGLGAETPGAGFSLSSRSAWRSLSLALERAFLSGHWPDPGSDVALGGGDDGVPQWMRVRVRFTTGLLGPGELLEGDAGQGLGEPLAVVFVEELRRIEDRQRQERLVSIGRISTSIAHEIRNPLAAVSQANALLLEDSGLRPDQRLLGRMIGDNVERLKRIVEDVLEAAPAGGQPSPVIELVEEVRAVVEEWGRTAGVPVGEEGVLHLLPPAGALPVLFDPHHLRRVLVNLLDNALRHSSGCPGAVQVTLEALDGDFARLCVANDGDLIPPDVERYLFEPFHSTRSRGTGLGLYICRELCQRHGGIIDYVRRPGAPHGNLFMVVLRRENVHPAVQGRSEPGRLLAGLS
ncbi:ATP-binding protein [Ideonella livida]|uniref:histidine kinase n=1 Tax=Ideonella livida TaxID=2707176 RepID=A0A7C9TKX4_9BURK|nr:ATP-binding protein [Ideonella livida]NDY93060.1 PAS domain-containing protein [Ideonella livida]